MWGGYFENLDQEAPPQAMALAKELIENQTGPFEPETMPNHYAERVHELVQEKIAQATPDVVVASDSGMAPPVVNIMRALKESVQARGREKISAAARCRMGKGPTSKNSSKLSRERRIARARRYSKRDKVAADVKKTVGVTPT
jgi:non-homologous end joining protein Ku